MAPQKSQLQLTVSVSVGVFIVCMSTFVAAATVGNGNGDDNEVQVPQNGVARVGAVTILNDDVGRKCGKHCKPLDTDDQGADVPDGDNDDEGYQDGDHEEDSDENGVEFVDQRQNGTENYRIRVNGLLLIIAPPEMPMPMPTTSTTAAPLVPPTPSNGTTAWNSHKSRLAVRRHDTNIVEQQKRKFSRYQARIPQFIKALLRNRHAQYNQ